MDVGELMAWQWSDYTLKHQHRTNLLIHIVAVPVFMAGTVLLLLGLLDLDFGTLGLGLAAWALAVIFEGRGHKLEQETPAPFTGSGNFVARFFLEQWITFPRFVLSGGWAANLRKAKVR
jgi:hypothetical protein